MLGTNAFRCSGNYPFECIGGFGSFGKCHRSHDSKTAGRCRDLSDRIYCADRVECEAHGLYR